MFRKITKNIRLFRDLGRFKSLPYKALLASTPEDIDEARRLHANAFLKHGYISEKDVDPRGIMNPEVDPYHAHSKYFIVVDTSLDDEIVGSVRLIMPKKGLGYDSFQMMVKSDLYKGEKSIIKAHSLDSIVEVSGLAKKRGAPSIIPMYLYRKIWHYSLEHGIEIWLMIINVKAQKPIRRIFGSTFKIVGHTVDYMNTPVTPITIKPIDAMNDLISEISELHLGPRRAVLTRVMKFFIHDLDPKLLTREFVDRLKSLL